MRVSEIAGEQTLRHVLLVCIFCPSSPPVVKAVSPINGILLICALIVRMVSSDESPCARLRRGIVRAVPSKQSRGNSITKWCATSAGKEKGQAFGESCQDAWAKWLVSVDTSGLRHFFCIESASRSKLISRCLFSMLSLYGPQSERVQATQSEGF